MNDFERELVELLNKHSVELGSDTPDFVLARYVRQCLAAFDIATNAREEWYCGSIEEGGS